jgi:protein tyrosine phosphatase (PTP) superfamily phosphohydrolase (DUF442 family)
MAATSTSDATPPGSAGSSRGRSRRRAQASAIVAGVLGGILLAAAVQAYYVFLGGNLHTVIAGSVYRRAQPSGADLEQLARTQGIRTVINLRGQNEDMPWYVEETEAARQLGVRLIDVGMWGCYPPMPDQLGALVEALDQAEYPLLLHCHSGSDRAGLASALVLLLRTDTSIEQARRQLALRYGHYPYGLARCNDRVLVNYGAWLKNQGLQHSAGNLRRWVRDGYDREACLVRPSDRSPRRAAIPVP